jgi:hypothetical protein
MKMIKKWLGFILLLLALSSCKKKVVPPNNEANGKGIIYIEVGNDELLVHKPRLLFNSKKQVASLSNGLQNGAPFWQIIDRDTSLSGYKAYKFDIQVQTSKERISAGFNLEVWFKDMNSDVLIRRINKNREIVIYDNDGKFKSYYTVGVNKFKVNDIRKDEDGKTYMNFEADLLCVEDGNTSNEIDSYWKGDILVSN